MDINQIDLALFEIEQMVEVAIGADESLGGSDADKEIFQMPRKDADLLGFALFDVQKRIEKLRASLVKET
jgi:hypothetical protein